MRGAIRGMQGGQKKGPIRFVGVHWIAFDRVILFLPLLAARKGLLFVDFDLKRACLLTRGQKQNCSGMIV